MESGPVIIDLRYHVWTAFVADKKKMPVALRQASRENLQVNLAYQREPPPYPPPPPPPRYPPRPPPPRLSCGLASFTLSSRPSTSFPLSCAIAFSASSFEAISTKPNPRERPVSRSSTILADSTVPIAPNRSLRS